MNDLGPRLIKLSGGIVCTNTLHRVEFNRKTNASQKLSAYLTPISTFGQLAAERLGRAYSGGVLKFELADARRLPILVGIGEFTTQLLVDVDKLLRAGKVDEARAAVDMAFMPSLFGRSWKKQRDELETELTRLRNSRRGIV
jgi:hypothetical protein